MSYKYLKDRKSYEDTYDRHTVEGLRRNERLAIESYKEAKRNLPKKLKDSDKDPEAELRKAFNLYHYFATDWAAGERWENKDKTIQEWMDKDEAKDQQLEDARLTKEPICQHCGKTGLRITSKDLLHKNDNAKWDDPYQVLIMLQCTSCKKNSAYWEDGTPLEPRHTYCPKCRAIMTEKSSFKGNIHTTKYKCPSCAHTYKDTYDFGKHETKEKPDPDFEKDKLRFCLNEEQGKKYLEAKHNMEGLKQLVDKWDYEKKNKALFDLVKSMDKPTIAQLIDLLKPLIEKAGYSEVRFDQPEIGKDVYIGFSCLDAKADRDDYTSTNILKKTVIKALANTNWRLMSDGISYRLGYLNGRLRAYESEEDLLKLAEKNPKLKGKIKATEVDSSENAWSIRGNDGKRIIL